MRKTRFSKILPVMALGFGLTACDTVSNSVANLDLDLRNNAGGLDTSDAARNATLSRPAPDSRGVISYPNYQVAVAQRGDSVASLSARVGGSAAEIASFNGLNVTDVLNQGVIVALPRSVPVPAVLTQPGAQPGPVDISGIATSAIDRAPSGGGIARAQPSKRIDGPEPVRHQVKRGETAFTIARLYNVSVRALSDWNGLGPDLEVREDQYLLIPVSSAGTGQATPVSAAGSAAPGQGTATPVPPSAATPLPEPVAVAPKPAAPLAAPAAASAAFSAPVSGKVLRPYTKGKNEGIDIAAATGTAVQAAADGTVAAITRDTDQVPILVVRHPGNVLTVYANISAIGVKKGDKVTKGQALAKVGPGNPPFLHFEIREGFESVNPSKYLK
jgi:LysM repeat protein